MYCNKKVTTDDYAGFNLGRENWSDYSILYRMKFTSGKGGELETHIRKKSNRQGEYRSIISNLTGSTDLKFTQLAIVDDIIAGYRDGLGDAWDRSIILTLTEFGRTVSENGTRGSDHGYGSAGLLAGGAITKSNIISHIKSF